MIQIRYRFRVSLLQVQISGMSALEDGVLLLHGSVSLSSGETLTGKGIFGFLILTVLFENSFPVFPVWSSTCPECSSSPPLFNKAVRLLLVYRTIHSLAVVIWRVNHLSVRYLCMGFRFNGCKRSRRIGLEAAISETLRRTTASSLGDSLSCRRKYGCRVIWVCSCLDSSYWSSLGIVVGSCRSRCFKV
ncbi:hypothetical protein Bca4012_002351 [Brassica carinata]